MFCANAVVIPGFDSPVQGCLDAIEENEDEADFMDRIGHIQKFSASHIEKYLPICFDCALSDVAPQTFYPDVVHRPMIKI